MGEGDGEGEGEREVLNTATYYAHPCPYMFVLDPRLDNHNATTNNNPKIDHAHHDNNDATNPTYTHVNATYWTPGGGRAGGPRGPLGVVPRQAARGTAILYLDISYYTVM